MSNEDRELLADELEREVEGAIRDALGKYIEWEEELLAGRALLAELRKRRIVLYRRAVHTLPPGLHQVTLEELVDESSGRPQLPEEPPTLGVPPSGGGATSHEPAGDPVAADNTLRDRGEK